MDEMGGVDSAEARKALNLLDMAYEMRGEESLFKTTKLSLRAPKTEAFKNWFGDSKVVDEKGEPLVVYHGTDKNLTEFRSPADRGVGYQSGIYFTSESEYADIYGKDGAVYPVYISIRNPLDLTKTSEISGWKGAIARLIAPRLAAKVEQEALLRNAQSQSLILPEERARLEAAGYDGIKGAGGVWIAFNPTQIKSATGNDGTYSKTNPDIRYSLRDKLGMYSELENKIEAGSNKAPAASWKAYINGLTQKGVKPDEIEWSGVKDWLDLQKGTVTKDELLTYLKEGGVKVEEVVLENRGATEFFVEDDDGNVIAEYPTEVEAQHEQQRLEDERDDDGQQQMYYVRSPDSVIINDTKYGTYTLPGGENYREVLLTLPSQEPPTSFEWTSLGDGSGSALKIFVNGKVSFDSKGKAYPTDKVDEAEKQALRNAGVEPTAYRSSHWDQPNVLAHIRVNDRTDADGNKVLFVEEIQSDWSQGGRKKGFKSNKEEAAYVAFLNNLENKAYQEFKNDFANEGVSEERQEKLAKSMAQKLASDARKLAEYFGKEDERQSLHEARIKAREMLPAAPFVATQQFAVYKDDKELVTQNKEGKDVRHRYDKLETAQTAATKFGGEVRDLGMQANTEGWLNLALKRIMVLAAEGGYDRVAFVRGEQAAERFSLDKQVKLIRAVKHSDGKWTLWAVPIGSNISQELTPKNGATPEALEELVGKEMADKIINETGVVVKTGASDDFKKNVRDYEGNDLKIEAKGMRAFYDSIVPGAVKKLLPKVGGGQMGSVSLSRSKDLRIVKDDDGTYAIEKRMLDEFDNPYFEPIAFNLTKEQATQQLRNDVRVQQPGFDVTPAMQDKVKTTGLPRFSLRSTFPQSTQASIDRITTARKDKGFISRMMDAISPTEFSKYRQQYLNRYNQLGKYDKMLANKMGITGLLADASSEAAALQSDLGAGLTASALGVHDRVGGIPVFRNGITVISNVNGTVGGPMQIFAKLTELGKGDPYIYQSYQLWAGAKRASRFNAQGIDTPYTAADLQEAANLERMYPEFKQIQKDYIKFNDGLVQYMLDTGIIDKEGAKKFSEHADYIPFYRQLDGEATIGPNIFQSISGVKQPRKIKGGEAPLADFMETIVRNTQSIIQAGVKNTAAQRAVNVAMQLGPNFIKPLNYASSLPSDIMILENGLKKYYRSSDPLWIESLKALNAADLPFNALISGPANLLRTMVTKDPGFMLANMMRDSLAAYTTSGIKMVPIVDTIKNFTGAIAGKSPEFQALLNAGILGGHEFSQNIEYSGKVLSKELRKKTGTTTTTEKVLSPFTGLWSALEKGTTASDAATRMEVYKKTLAETGNEAEALFRALEVMNFNRKGSSPVIRVITAAIPFLNARIQGLDVLYRAGFGKINSANAEQIQRSFFIRGATMMGLSAMYWALTHDDDEYKKQEAETRDNYWLLPSLGIKIPIPFEIGILFKVIPERILAYSFGDDTGQDFMQSMARQLMSTLAFNPIPQAALPIVEARTNHSFFTQRPIVGQGLEGVEPGYQVGPGTTNIAADIGKALNISPMKLDHMIKGYSGTMGMYLMDVVDSVYSMNSDIEKPSKRLDQMPVLKRFMIDPEARGTVTAYYEMKNAADQAVRTSNLLERTFKFNDRAEYLQENGKMLVAEEYVKTLEKTMKQFREMRLMVRSSNMSGDDKQNALNQITAAENKLTSNIQAMKKALQ
jgi:hypothetical protein